MRSPKKPSCWSNTQEDLKKIVSQGKKKSIVKTLSLIFLSPVSLPILLKSHTVTCTCFWILFYFFAFPFLPNQRTPTGTDQSWTRPVHLPDVAHKVLYTVLCLFWLHLTELVQSDELNSFITMWQEDDQSATSNLPALFKGLNSSWPWPQTASCLALGGSGILVCFIARDTCTEPGRVPLLKLLWSIEPNRIKGIKKSSEGRSVSLCISSTQTHPTQGYFCTSSKLRQGKDMPEREDKPNKGVGVS